VERRGEGIFIQLDEDLVVDTDLIHHYADDGDFYCVNCWVITE
jgi:hypothetical protein